MSLWLDWFSATVGHLFVINDIIMYNSFTCDAADSNWPRLYYYIHETVIGIGLATVSQYLWLILWRGILKLNLVQLTIQFYKW